MRGSRAECFLRSMEKLDTCVFMSGHAEDLRLDGRLSSGRSRAHGLCHFDPCICSASQDTVLPASRARAENEAPKAASKEDSNGFPEARPACYPGIQVGS